MISTSLEEKIEAVFGIKREEYVIVFSLFAYLLFVIAAYVVSKTVRDALFLSKFGAMKLPYMYIGIAVLVGGFVSVYLKISNRVRQNRLISLTLVFFISNAALFWWLFKFKLDWLYPVIYIWAGIFGVIAPMQVWTLSNFVLTTRQAKRLYGFIGSGGLLGGILGGFFTSWMAPRIGTENLLLTLTVFMALCILLVNTIWRRSGRAVEEAEKAEQKKPEEVSLKQSLRLIMQSRYLLLIAGIISIGSIVTTIVDYQFKAITKMEILSGDQLAAFFGSFYGYLGLASFALQILLTGRLMRRFGIGVTIFLLPLSLAIGSIGLLAFMSLWTAVILKAPDQLLKHSIDRSTLELLYLPVPSDIKTGAKSFIDSVIWRFADGGAGLILIFFISVLGLSIQQISLGNLVLTGIWLLIAYVTRREYVEAVRSSIARKEIDPDKLSVTIQDPATIAGLIASVNSRDTGEVLYLLQLIELVDDRAKLAPHLTQFLEHESAEVRVKTLQLLNGADDDRLAEKVRKLLEDESPEVQVEAIQFLCMRSGKEPMELAQTFLDDADYKIKGAAASFMVITRGEDEYCVIATKILELMLKSPDPAARREAARALGVIKNRSPLHQSLKDLLQDPDAEVVRQALTSAVKIHHRESVPLIIVRLADRETKAAAKEALIKYGHRALGTLRDNLVDDSNDIEIRKSIAWIIGSINSQEAADILINNLSEPNPDVRRAVIRGLNRLKNRFPDLHFPTARVHEQICQEVREGYSLLSPLLAYRPSHPWKLGRRHVDDLLQRGLEGKLEDVTERIFRLLGLIYSSNDLYLTYQSMLNENPVIQANALELLDNLLGTDDKQWILAMIDESVPIADRIEVGRSLGVKVYSDQNEVLSDLLESDDPFIVLAAIEAVYTNRLTAVYDGIEQATHHQRQLVREAAEKVWMAIQSKQVEKEDNMSELSTLEKLRFFQKMTLFSTCKVDQLLEIAAAAKAESFKKGDVIFGEEDRCDSLYCIVRGSAVLSRDGLIVQFQENEVFGLLSLIDKDLKEGIAIAGEDLLTLKINMAAFYELVEDHIEITKGVFNYLTKSIKDRVIPAITELKNYK